MYAVIRAGGKQYRVAPGDVIKIETSAAENGKVTFDGASVLAVSTEAGKIGKPNGGTSVTGQVVNEGRGDKVLVFKFKRKKQYKKMQGHRQGYTAVRITEIAFEGNKATAPALEKKEKKAKPAAEKTEKKAAAMKEEAPSKKLAKAHKKQASAKRKTTAKKAAKKSSKKK